MLEDIVIFIKRSAKAFETSRTTREHDRAACLLLLSAFVSAVAAGIIGCLLRATIVGHSRSPALALVFSAIYVVSIVAVASSSGEAQIRFLPEFSSASKRSLLLTLLCGSPWLGPVIILCSAGGLATLLSLGALAFFQGTLLGHFGNLVHSIAQRPSEIRKRKPLFGFSGTSSAATQQFDLKVATCIGYLGILTVVSHGENAIAATLIATSLFFGGWIKQQSTLAEKQVPAKVALRLSQHSIWAIFVTLLALLPHAGNYSLSQLVGPFLTPGKDSNLGKLQSGVVLFVRRKPPTIGLQLENGPKLHSQTVAHAFSIPFSGEYWFFPRPRSPVPGDDWFGDDWFLQRMHKVPGASFLREEGNPININVTLEDTGEMVMQAQQRIGHPVELRSCRWIDVVLDGEDEQPEKVDIELFLVDSSAKGQKMQTLGVRSLTNPADVSTSANVKMSSFRFAVLPTSEIQSFNELLVWFHLKGPHMQKAPTVKIDRFDLIP